VDRNHLGKSLLAGAGALALGACSVTEDRAASASVAPKVARVPDMSGVPLLPRELLFGDAARTAVRISPDGSKLSWLAPVDGILNLWVAPAGDPGAARPATAEKKRPLSRYLWAPDSQSLLVALDNDGDENWRLFSVSATGGAMRTLVAEKDATVSIEAISPRVRNRIVVGLNDRDPKWHDLYSIDLASGQRTLLLRNDGRFSRWIFDADLNLRLARSDGDDGGYSMHRVVDGKVEEKAFETVPFEEVRTTRPLSFAGDGRTVYWADARGRDTAALFAVDIDTARRTLLAEDVRADLSSLVTHPGTGDAEAFELNYTTLEYRPIGSAIAGDLKVLQQKFGNDFYLPSRSSDNRRWVVVVDPIRAPGEYWLYDRPTKALTRLFLSRHDLEGKPLAAMHPLEIKSRDGLTLVSYLTLPPGSDANADGVPDHPVPMVIVVHGGPWGRSEYGSSPTHQLLANRGYAVLEPNFRASTGFGKAFVAAGNGEWGRKMQDDLLDAVDWAVAKGITSQDKVAIMGGSYGGYATLAALTMTPDRFACGVDMVGPSNLETLLASMPAYWESMRNQLYRRMGDPRTPEGLAWLKERSPLYLADRISKPLLIGQGAKDPRVKVAEAEQIVDAMTKRSIPVTYILFPDEGHGLRRAPNRIGWKAIQEQFLANCLGGRAEPVGNSFASSSGEVKVGGSLILGLPPAEAETAAK
jgi:dipeptidyl aminopeptidase/acylaminoacyl peptidase